MGKTLMIGSCEPFSGKSALVLGIARHLMASKKKIRFGKPLATSIELDMEIVAPIGSGPLIDDDVRFVGKTLKLSFDDLIPSIQFLAASTASNRIQNNILDAGINNLNDLFSSIEKTVGFNINSDLITGTSEGRGISIPLPLMDSLNTHCNYCSYFN